MRHYNYQLTLTLPSASGRQTPGTALLRESLTIDNSPSSYTRSCRIDPAARTAPTPEAARWTPAEEDAGYHAA